MEKGLRRHNTHRLSQSDAVERTEATQRNGEFLNAEQGQKVLEYAADDDYTFATVENLRTRI